MSMLLFAAVYWSSLGGYLLLGGVPCTLENVHSTPVLHCVPLTPTHLESHILHSCLCSRCPMATGKSSLVTCCHLGDQGSSTYFRNAAHSQRAKCHLRVSSQPLEIVRCDRAQGPSTQHSSELQRQSGFLPEW